MNGERERKNVKREREREKNVERKREDEMKVSKGEIEKEGWMKERACEEK